MNERLLYIKTNEHEIKQNTKQKDQESLSEPFLNMEYILLVISLVVFRSSSPFLFTRFLTVQIYSLAERISVNYLCLHRH